MALVLVAVVVAVAYGSSTPAIGVAEFSPSANRALEAPPTTSPDSGAAGGAGGRRATTTTAPATTVAATDASGDAGPPTSQVARGRECYGSPPRQIPDPMSPPCIPTIFEGDNGGATSRGVNATEIRVSVPVWNGFTTDAGSYGPQMAAVNALFEYVNRHFELYGRKLVPVYVEGNAGNPVDARTKAIQISAGGVFAALTGPEEWSSVALPAMVQALAGDEIITIVRGASTWLSDRVVFDALHPYLWSVYPSSEDLQANIASFFCTSLAGKLASFAGTDALRDKTRKFGVLASGDTTAPFTSLLVKNVSDCTGEQMIKVETTNSSGSAARTAGIAKLKAEGVTTVVCLCEQFQSGSGISAANSAGYYPEWLVLPNALASGNGEYDIQSSRRNNQLAPPMRMSAGPKLLPMQSRPWFGALQEINNTLMTTAPSTYAFYGVLGRAEFIWDGLLALATGIQGAGPQLTPESFASALMSTPFPNTGAGQAPFWQPTAGFGPGDHSLYDDYNVGWWSDTAPALDQISSSPQGSWCYLDQGARFRVGTYPVDATARMFNAGVACR